jgi:hypothetical protein
MSLLEVVLAFGVVIVLFKVWHKDEGELSERERA